MSDKRKKASGAAFRKAKVVENVISQTKNQSQGEEVCNDIATSSTADNENYTNDMPINEWIYFVLILVKAERACGMFMKNKEKQLEV